MIRSEIDRATRIEAERRSFSSGIIMEVGPRRLTATTSLTELTDFIFRFVCACHGLQTGFPKIRYLGSLCWLFVLVSLPFSVVLKYLEWARSISKPLSFADVVRTSAVIVESTSVLLNLHIFLIKHKSVEQLLQENARNTENVVVFTLRIFTVVTLIVRACCRTTEIGEVVLRTSSVFGELSKSIFFMIYVHVINNILQRLRNLNELSMDSRICLEELALDRSCIREQVRTVNSLFAVPLATHYAALFQTFLFVVASLVRSNPYEADLPAILVYSIGSTGMIFYIARKAFQLDFMSHTAEIRSTAIPVGNTEWKSSIKIIQLIHVFRYRSEWDSLRVACFTLNMNSFLGYLTTITTCAAIVLQFDSTTLRALNAVPAGNKAC